MHTQTQRYTYNDMCAQQTHTQTQTHKWETSPIFFIKGYKQECLHHKLFHPRLPSSAHSAAWTPETSPAKVIWFSVLTKPLKQLCLATLPSPPLTSPRLTSQDGLWTFNPANGEMVSCFSHVRLGREPVPPSVRCLPCLRTVAHPFEEVNLACGDSWCVFYFCTDKLSLGLIASNLYMHS